MARSPLQMVMPFAPVTSYNAADFLPGAANLNAYNIVHGWPNWPYSILLLFGPKGCGKTHLAHVFASLSGAIFIDPVRVGAVPADQLLTGGHCWVLDGAEEVKNEAALAQLINHARARGDYLLLTAHQSARDLPVKLPDLRSRLLALPAFVMGAPDDTLLKGVLAKSFADRQLRIASNVLDYAANHLERSYEAAQQFAASMDELSLAAGRAVTLPMVRQLLQSPAEEL